MPPTFSSGFTQCFPPAPSFVEKDVPDLAGKVRLILGIIATGRSQVDGDEEKVGETRR